MKTNREIFEKYADSATLDRIVKFDNLGAMWAARSSEFASLTAISQSDASVTFAELDASVSKLRAALKEAGIDATVDLATQTVTVNGCAHCLEKAKNEIYDLGFSPEVK